ncbi:histone-lysine N-methyltransferase, H3 lysine-9 specific SUVH6-like isoform X1 [Arachis ipaensis]|uniref:histone-lysine N-methyltransferase, H3 lysine-9 specific SUVH6-like isoform X1 n=1 Tax=Arachis ipaensis TaxID=130454 RepID=UPI000A2B1905|nr:histone-lysine N-methyltransferase, H3 lysine-9 specific SUVH6-like isoform X1 [Arachis ipaensis]XP_025627589.1 histone-lysine N-methyltransferase, H3 lysine-9 specific SUVH6 isoform X2 [Arachis hypogaea]
MVDKRHKVPAFRDFPKGCGSNPSRTAHGDAAKVVPGNHYKRVPAFRDFPPLCGPNASSHLSEGEGETAIDAEEEVEKNVHCDGGKVLDLVQGDSGGNGVEKEKELDVIRTCVTVPKDGNRDKVQMNSYNLRVSSRRVVLALMAESECPWRNAARKKGKKPLKKKKGNDNSENIDEFQVVNKSHGSKAVYRKLVHEEEAKLEGKASSFRSVDLRAAEILMGKGKYLNTNRILGSVPGVEVGDEFQYRVELAMVGLHQRIQSDIDYVMHNGKTLAMSVITLGGYEDELDDSNVLIYTSLVGNNTDKEVEDQKLEQCNRALRNSIDEKNPVRVIRATESMHGKGKKYVYDGQYVVENCWQDDGPHGSPVLRYRLQRIPDQPEPSWKEVKKSENLRDREGLFVHDISNGKELIPIHALNTIDDQNVPSFVYVTRMIYPNWCNPIPRKGCNCVGTCSESEKCPCAAKNGGDIPFNHDGAIVEAKPLIYECGLSCKCPSTCHNRVSQHGVKFQLEVFKTDSRGWGVRSLNSIPSGSFICEYLGELLGEDEAEERVDNDEYLFDIGNNNQKSHALWDELSVVMPDAHSNSSCEVVEDGGFTIDALHYGNVGRFINHSCSPNLYAQSVLYDHDDKRIPHIMLFATENIPPLQELTYDYNYKIDEVFDSHGNIKRKNCYCGSMECTGRMY